ncbi:uncharacterized protein LOC117331779 [Pecten maximus]|uniref:uncharacterized protein LOC117331779 n=1 Tax=Pecten maximus TaxID=6579 RepID=UPI0014589C83|nr:uncharacterized protein LOC117331779 [Pecten maximus]
MDRQDAAKIRAHMDYIIGNLDVTDFQTELVGKGLTLDSINEIEELESVRDKNEKCLEYLMQSENSSYQTLIDLLRKNHYFKVVNKLESGLPPETASNKEELCKPCIHVPENKRNICLREVDLVHLSGTVSPKGKLAWSTCLGISQYDVEHIEMDNHHSPTQMMKILLHWRNIHGKGATLGVLMDKYNEALDNGVNINIEELDKLIADIKG